MFYRLSRCCFMFRLDSLTCTTRLLFVEKCTINITQDKALRWLDPRVFKCNGLGHHQHLWLICHMQVTKAKASFSNHKRSSISGRPLTYLGMINNWNIISPSFLLLSRVCYSWKQQSRLRAVRDSEADYKGAIPCSVSQPWTPVLAARAKPIARLARMTKAHFVCVSHSREDEETIGRIPALHKLRLKTGWTKMEGLWDLCYCFIERTSAQLYLRFYGQSTD